MPQVCFGCNTQLYGGEHILCTVCRNDLPITDYNFLKENAVDRIFYGRIPVKKASSLLFFSQNGIVKQLLHHLKYKNQEQIGEFLGDWYGEILKEQGGLEDIDAIIPVPLHHKKLKKRGYNQVTLFGERLSHYLNAPFLKFVLIKTANTKTLTKKNRFNRWQTTKELYKISDYDSLKNKKVLLIDDVITTGATIEACGSALLKIEGLELYVATMAVVPKYS
ncbi:ComF family protein [Croceitalea marina]|uniref:ComF family protein n=1 Tax=Croceitalea marina TaxID=1775166 RepID=A0ABW5MW42_9FLAO